MRYQVQTTRTIHVLLEKLGTKCVTKCKPQGPYVYFWKARDQIQILVNHRNHRCTLLLPKFSFRHV
ncbi:hypothetical protein Hanom_Chr01g00086331 [Helianthus anomalus]